MRTVPQHTLTRVIHETESAVVYRGHRDADRAAVTVKLLKHEYPSQRDLARLKHEYSIMRSLRIAGVLEAYSLERSGNGLALVMEDRGGRPLNQILKEQRLDLGAALRIASSLAGVLDSLHRSHVIHKDIKPHNVLYNAQSGEVTLIDFGIAARLSQEIQRPTSPDLLDATLSYMSPEQTGRMNRHIDHRTDLYSLGVTLYEMLTGALPFQSRDPMELVHSHIARSPAPPREVSPDIPGPVSDIVMKLLAKAAEDRYQGARGLKADLDECLRQWEASGRIEPFALGRLDLGGELRLPQRLYGREAEERELLAAWTRAGHGKAECLLIAGYAGVGKSALVNEIYKGIARGRGGYFVAGKFDKLNRSKPYAPIVDALRELVRQILTEPAEALERWQRRLRAAIEPNGQIVAELIPEILLLLGPQPSLPELAPAEAQNRFALVLASFVRAFTAEEHPLAVFLDDLQWADPASLRLLRILLADPQSGHLLVIGAYRDDEVDASHPLTAAVHDLRDEGATVRAMTLQPLSLPVVGQMLADALSCDPARSAPLAEMLLQKTQGNPFFINQLLRMLHDEQLISFDARAGAWTWDLERIRGANITDNVVALMTRKLAGLAPATQRVLKLAACIGHQFRLSTLATLDERSRADTAAALWEALQEGLVQPLDADYRFLQAGEPGASELPPGEPFDVSYRFLHDRVQHAAYAMLEDGRERETHLRVGRLMRAGRSPDELGDDLFDVVNHMNVGAALVADPAERRALAQANLIAGRRAKAAAAYQAAASYLEVGRSVLSASSWEDDHELALALHVEGAECASINGQFAASDALFEEALARGKTRLALAHVYCLQVNLCITAGRQPEAIRAGLRGLALFGIEIPSSEEGRKALLARELEEVKANLGERSIEDLVGLPDLIDPEQRALQKLLIYLTAPAYHDGPTLIAIVAVKQVNLSLKHGNSEGSAYGYVLYGFILAGGMDRYEEGYRFGRLAHAVHDRFGGAELTAKVNMVFGVYLHFCRPVREALEYFKRAYRADLTSGDFVYTSHACLYTTIIRLSLGEDLGAVGEELERFLGLTRRTKEAMAIGFLTIAKHLIAALEGRTLSRASLGDDAFDEAAFVAAQEAAGAHFVTSWYYTVKAQLCFLYGDPRGALAMADLAEERIGTSAAQYFATELSFYLCMAIWALYPEASPEERSRYAARVELHQAKLARLSAACPGNFKQKHLLVLAEQARASGRETEAIDLYDEAIEAARESGFTSLEALANERCGTLYLAKGKAKIARTYMSDAHHGYLRWGASAKAEDLAERTPHLLPQAQASAVPDARAATTFSATVTTTSKVLASELLDAAATVRAAQAIAGELELDRVLEQLLKLVIESAGAQRASLLLARGDRLTLEATITVDPDKVELGLGVPLEASADLPRTIVNYVARTKEPLVLGHASAGGRFSGDPCIAARQSKSVLCLALVRKGRLTGILYMENNAVQDAFTPRQVEHCALLASQAATAVENARLYQNVQAMTEALKRANEALESEVARRTEQLRDANERLSLELSERERGEAERARLQEEIIRAQDARLLEMSTPVIPITDRILVMPLIGSMDERRAQQVLSAALEGVQAHRAEVVILDITGVKLVDTSVASTLLRTADALRLLGARAMLTGMSPQVAQTLVGLGVNLEGIATMGTLRSGVARALRRSGP